MALLSDEEYAKNGRTRDTLHGLIGWMEPFPGAPIAGLVDGFLGQFLPRSPSEQKWALEMAVADFGTNLLGSAIIQQVEKYTLRAARDGFYPVMRRGFREPQAGAFLHAGDIWKHGTTKNPATRYSHAFLDRWGLRYETNSTGSLDDALAAERQSILDYLYLNGELPPGNKIVR